MIHKQSIFFVLISILFVFLGCDEKPQRKEKKIKYISQDKAISQLLDEFTKELKNKKEENKSIKSENTIQIKKEYKSSFQLAKEFMKELKINKVDTIIYYKRGIRYNDFYNIFWVKNGKKYLQKINSDTMMQPISKGIAISKIFTAVFENYKMVKNTSVKENSYTQKDGTKYQVGSSHSRYTQTDIYLGKDSIVNGYLKDYSFDKYSYLDDSLINDHYIYNTSSKWHFLLTIIENELAIMPETTQNEIQNFRSKR